MSRVVQANGAQILPPAGDQRATVTMWVAQQCADADHRTKYPVYADVAAGLKVER